MSFRFSVLIPTFNRAELLRETIESVLVQSFQNYELIVVDDGSTDRTWDLLQSYGTQVKALRQSNQGPEVARNLGAAHATGEYLALLDSDDLMLPNALATYDQVIRECASPVLVIGAVDYFTQARPRPESSGSPATIEGWKYPDFLSKQVGVFLSSSNVLIQKTAFDQAGGLRLSTPTTYQVDTFATVLRFGIAGSCFVLKRPATVAYRVHAGNTVNNLAAMVNAMRLLIAEERQGLFPGGRERRFARYACLGGWAFFWVRNALRARRPAEAGKLLVNSGPMLAAFVMKKIRCAIHPTVQAVRIPRPTHAGIDFHSRGLAS
ncbi:MAG: glycosyltransferase [Verrucomicrobiota bacterium]